MPQKHYNKWKARIHIRPWGMFYLGLFATKEEAEEVEREAKVRIRENINQTDRAGLSGRDVYI
jgi:hypothetical protein